MGTDMDMTPNHKTPGIIILLLSGAFLYLGAHQSAAAQAALTLDESTALQMHRHARPGHVTMTLHVMGDVGDTGLWRVEQGIDFVELLTVLNAGSIRTSRVDVNTNVYVQVFRTQGSGRQEIYGAWLEDAIRGETAAPELQEADVLKLTSHTRRRLSIRTVSAVVGAISSIVLLGFRLTGR